MNITLPQALEEFVQTQVASGLYESPSEVHREALRLLMVHQSHRDRLDTLRASIDVGIEQADRGEARPCTPQDIIQLSKARREAHSGG